MFPMYKELVAPTVITHAVEGRFTPRCGRDLVVVKSSLVQLYHIIEDEVSDGSEFLLMFGIG